MRKTKRYRGWGFSPVELLVALVIVAVALLAGVLVAGQARSRWTARGVAMTLLSDIRWAREEAQSTGWPAGIVLPAGAAGCQSYAVVEGDPSGGEMHVKRLVDWSQNAPSTYLVEAGIGGTDPATSYPSRDSSQLQAALAQWGKANAGRYLGFGPTGVPQAPSGASGLTRGPGGGFSLVIAPGAQSSGGVLSRAWGPAYTVTVSSGGGTTMTEGVPGMKLSASAPQPPAVARFAGLVEGDEGPNASPVVVPTNEPGLEFQSDAMDATLADSATVYQFGRIDLEVMATDSDGDRLYASWGDSAYSDPKSHAVRTDSPTVMPLGSGTYSVGGLLPMSWGPNAQKAGLGAWVSSAEWTPPKDAKVGSWHALGARVDDLRGGAATRWITVQIGLSQGRVAYCDDQHYVLYLSNFDGTDRQRVSRETSLAGDNFPNLSPDGLRVAYDRSAGNTSQVWIMNHDGSDCHELALPAPLRKAGEPVWSPDGSRLAVLYGAGVHGYLRDNNPTPVNVAIVDAGPSLAHPDLNPVLVTRSDPNGWATRATWSPDGSALAYIWAEGHGSPPDLWLATHLERRVPTLTQLTADNADSGSGAGGFTYDGVGCAWSPDGKYIVWEYLGALRIMAVDLRDPDHPRVKPVDEPGASFVSPPVRENSPPLVSGGRGDAVWSPDGQYLLYGDVHGNGLKQVRFRLNNYPVAPSSAFPSSDMTIINPSWSR